jgi:DNA-binding transcriptional LysR family regulator
MALKLRQIEAFRAVMREGSMVRASAAMAITQPAVSYLIGSLEQAVGFPLFSRQGGKLSATPEALQLMTEVEHLYDGLDAIENVARRIAKYEKTVVRILVTQPSVGRIVNVIGKFAAAHPGLRLSLDVDRRATIVHRIQSGQAELGILSLSPGVEALGTRLFSNELLCVATNPGLLDGHAAVSPQHLTSMPMVGLSEIGVIRPMVDAWFAQAGCKPNYVVDTGEAGMALELVRSGLGITVVGTVSISLRELENSGLKAVPLVPPLHVEMGAIVPPSQHPNRAVSALIDYLKLNISK